MDNYFTRKSTKSGKLTKILSLAYPDLPYNLLMRLLRKRDIFINRKRVGVDSAVMQGDEISLFLQPNAVPLNIRFQNDYLLCVYKQKGIKSDGDYSLESLVRYVYPQSVLIHRLDTNTEGLVLFAKNDEVADYLVDLMKNGGIEKTYLATVYGEPNFHNTEITGYLVKNAETGRVKVYREFHKDSVKVSMMCTTVSRKNGLSTLQVRIHNGKTHQIRAQLSSIGYFIIGDGKYGDDRINRLHGYKSQELKAVRIEFGDFADKYGLKNLIIDA